MKAISSLLSFILMFVLNSLTAKEVISLELGRHYFIPGDTIRFNAALVDDEALNSNIRSNFIYVELLKDSVISRVKIKRSGDGFSGYLAVNDDLPIGEYIFRAYTRYMLNGSPADCFFTKIHVIKPNEPFIWRESNLSIPDEISTKTNDVNTPKSFLKESFHQIEGWVENGFGKRVKSYILDIFSPQTGFTRQAVIEKNPGNFLITELDTREGTQYIIKATDLSGLKRYYPVCLPETFAPYYDYFALYSTETETVNLPLNNQVPVILYDTSGTTRLEAVKIVADKKQNNGFYIPKINPSPFGNSFERRSVKEREDLKRDDHKSVLEYIVANYPSFFVFDDYLFSRRSFTTKGSGGSPAYNKTIIYIDGVRYDDDDDDLEFPALKGMDVRDVETLIVLNGNDGLLYKSISGVVLISTRRYRPGDSNTRSNLLIYTPLGYQ